MGIILAILIFSFVVMFHEFGHFLLAKLNGIAVEEFALGMGPALFRKDFKGTTYSLRILPIGGFCAMGEDEQATDAPDNFNNKSVWARLSVIAAGPIFNFILAFIFAVIIVFMTGYDETVIHDVDPGYPAAEAGISAGDTIVKMGGRKVNVFREISFYNTFHQGEDVEITFLHDGELKTATLTPKFDDERQTYRYGVTSGGYKKANLLTGLEYGAYEVRFWINVTLDSIKMLVTRKLGMDQLSGPVGVVSVVDSTYKESKSYGLYVVVVQMLNIAILLSANLGVMNLIPFPALDGGRLIFLYIEAITRKRVPPEKEGYVHMLGMVLLMALMVFVMFNDVKKLFI